MRQQQAAGSGPAAPAAQLYPSARSSKAAAWSATQAAPGPRARLPHRSAPGRPPAAPAARRRAQTPPRQCPAPPRRPAGARPPTRPPARPPAPAAAAARPPCPPAACAGTSACPAAPLGGPDVSFFGCRSKHALRLTAEPPPESRRAGLFARPAAYGGTGLGCRPTRIELCVCTHLHVHLNHDACRQHTSHSASRTAASPRQAGAAAAASSTGNAASRTCTAGGRADPPPPNSRKRSAAASRRSSPAAAAQVAC